MKTRISTLVSSSKPATPLSLRGKILGASMFVLLGIVGCNSGSKPEQATAPTPAAPTTPAVNPSPSESPSFVEGAKPSVDVKNSPSPSPVVQNSPSSASPSPSTSPTPSATPSPESTPTPQTNTAEQGLVAFTDIDELPTKKYVTELQALEVFGITESEFRPYEPVTRGEYITWLYQANNTIRREKNHLHLDPTFEPDFSDISEDHPAYKYVQAFANAGYAVGYEDKTFKPDQPITREEMIAIKVGLDTEKNHKPTKLGLNYADADQVDPRYSGFIRIDHTQNNIERAFGNVKTLKPKQAVKRHEAAATLWKIRFDTANKALKKKRQSEE